MNAIKRNIPNIITLSNLFCGLLSIVLIFDENFILSGSFILLGALFDFLDGFTARFLSAYSEFGKQLDSFSDLVTFGIAPAMILFQLFSCTKVSFPLIICFLFPICAAIRLSKFNINDEQKNEFIGLPTPAAGIFIAAISLNYNQTNIFGNEIFLLIISIILPILLVSKIRFFSLKINKGESKKSKENIFRIILIISSIIILLSTFSFVTIPFIVILYLILSITNNLI